MQRMSFFSLSVVNIRRINHCRAEATLAVFQYIMAIFSLVLPEGNSVKVEHSSNFHGYFARH